MKSWLILSTRVTLVSLLLVLFFDWNPPSLSLSPQLPIDVADAAQNPYDLGLGYFQNNVGLSDDAAWLQAKDAAHLALIQRNWQEAANPGGASYYDAVASQVSLARSNGLKIYLGLDVLSGDRTTLQLPAALRGLTGGFSNSQIRSAYVDLVRKVAADFQPQYFVIAVEVNMYKGSNSTDYNAYKSLYATAYKAIKSVSPQTKVAASLLYSDFNGVNCIDSSDKTRFKGHVADFNNRQNVSDIFAVSTYPFCYFTPAAIPSTFLSELARFSSRPLFISETGWISDSYQITPTVTFQSDPATQAAYVDRLSQLTDYARGRGYKVSAVTYISLVDPDSAYCALIQQITPQNGWYCVLSLLDAQADQKPAFGRMKLWKGRLG
ncbi:MAG: hypothetical protein EPO21_07305 [Chloroflexota bacterium]|nr:MAG: hypothetical protein EPO21_07305 [Chloroflexota bacterium]